MPLIFNTNISSIMAQSSLSKSTKALQKSMQKLATGNRINTAADDAAGLQIAEGLAGQVRGSQKSIDNVQDGINALNITDGALSEIIDIVQRMRELVVQAANDSFGPSQKNNMDTELDQLAQEITRIGDSLQFNGRNLLDGSQSAIGSYKIQIGSSSNLSQNTIDIVSVFSNLDAVSMAIDNPNINIDTNANALTALDKLDTALQSLTSRRATVGSFMFRLESVSQSLTMAVENQSSAESRIRNVDIAEESSKLTSEQILQQASTSVLSQANQSPKIVLQLLQGQ